MSSLVQENTILHGLRIFQLYIGVKLIYIQKKPLWNIIFSQAGDRLYYTILFFTFSAVFKIGEIFSILLQSRL